MDVEKSSALDLLDCIICDNLQPAANVITDLFARPRLLKLIVDISGIALTRDPCYPDRICRQCLITTNCYSEIACRFRNGLQKKYRQHYGSDPQRNGEDFNSRIMMDTSEQPNNRRPTTVQSDGGDDDGVQPPGTTNGRDEQHSTAAPSRNQGFPSAMSSPSSLLKPLFIVSEYVSATESGGNIHLDNDAMTARSQPFPMHACPTCGKEYAREYNLKRHRRHCRRPHSRASSAAQRQFYCPYADCLEIFADRVAVKAHISEQHLPWYSCSVCGYNDITTESEQQWHWHTCPMRHQAIVRREQQERDEFEAQSSLASSSANSTVSSASSTASGGSSTTHFRPRRSDRLQLKRLKSTCLDERLAVHSKRTQNRLQSTCSQWTSVSGRSSVALDRMMMEVEVSAVSKAPKISRRVRSQRSRIRRVMQKAARAEMTASSESKRLFYSRNKVKIFPCTDLECAEHELYLYDIMRHEMREHRMSCLFYCDACKEWFTTAEHYWGHHRTHSLTIVHPYQYEHHCAFCGDMFATHYELRHHLMEHFYTRNAYACSTCPRSFVNFSELATHLNNNHAGSDHNANRNSTLIQVRRSNPKNTASVPLRMLDGTSVADSLRAVPALNVPPAAGVSVVQPPARIPLPDYDPNAIRKWSGETTDKWAGYRKRNRNRSGDVQSFRKQSAAAITPTLPIPVLPAPWPSVLRSRRDEATIALSAPNATDADAAQHTDANDQTPSSSGDRAAVTTPVSVLSEGGWQTDEEDGNVAALHVIQPHMPRGVTIIKAYGNNPLKRNGMWTNEVKSKIRAAETHHPSVKRNALRKRADSSTKRARDQSPFSVNEDEQLVTNATAWLWPENRGSMRCRRYALKRQMLCVSPVGPTLPMLQPLSYGALTMHDMTWDRHVL